MISKWRQSRIWLLSAFVAYLIVLIVRGLFLSNASLTESVYSNTIFPLIRGMLNITFGLLPFSSIYILLPGLIALFIYLIRTKKKIKWYSSLEWVIGTVLYIIVGFYILWGYNYSRSEALDLFELDPFVPDSAYLRSEIERSERVLMEMESDTFINTFFVEKKGAKELGVKRPIETELRSFLEKYQVSMPGPVPLRMVYPRGLLMGFGASGVYFPLSGEANIDPGLPLELQPFVIAHELSHAYGITDEGTCNFIAYLVCQQVNHPWVRYSGEIQYFRYLLGNYRLNFPEDYDFLWSVLDPRIKDRLRKIRDELDAYPEFLPRLRPLIYDRYLKNQGIEEGMANYSKIIELWAAYRTTIDRSGSPEVTDPQSY